ncbi:MAG: hypothetical protein Q9184_005494 [Pyrenodesmia sp. 2 TL-2023]
MSHFIKNLPGEMSASELLAFNPEVNHILYMLPGATDPTDYLPYTLLAPPQTRPEQEKSQFARIQTSAIEKPVEAVDSSRFQTIGSGRSPSKLGYMIVTSATFFYRNCGFLVASIVPEVKNSFQRHGSNYPGIWSLRKWGARETGGVWSAKAFAHIFGVGWAQDPVPNSSGPLGDDGSHGGDAWQGNARTTSDDVNPSSHTPAISYHGDENSNCDENDDDDNVGFDGTCSDDDGSLNDGSDADRSDGDGCGFEKDGSNGDGSEGASLGAVGSDDDDLGELGHNDHPRETYLDASSTGFMSTQIFVAKWLARCQKNEDGQHMECNRTTGSWLPTRLLDVENTSENTVLRLVSSTESPDTFKADRRYVTLSHCWGAWGSKEIPALKVSNERERFHDGIRLEDLPLTFQQAVEVARWLKVRWLWIDSLCIIQDSKEDWQHEAPLMHNVYKEGFLNIAASSAYDARGGLFQQRSVYAIVPLKLNMPGIGEEWYVTLDERDMFNWMNTEPLSNRAWVFQERHLARRILHFTKDQVFWECCAKAPYFANEIFPHGAPLNKTFDDKPKMQSQSLSNQSVPSSQEIYDLWENLCWDYAEKNLSHGGDKLVALLGLAIEFKQLAPGDEYAAGIWLSTMPQSLLWDVREGYCPEPSLSQVHVAPSWSWASIPGPIRKQFRYREGKEKTVSVVDIKMDFSSKGSWGLSTPNLLVCGFIRRVTIKDNLAVNKVFPPTFDNKKELLIHQRPHQLTIADKWLGTGHMISYSLDSNIESNNADAYFLFLTSSEPSEKYGPELELNGLLLNSTPESDTFKRIGTLRIRNYGAIAVRYQVKPDVAEPVEAWDSFVGMLQSRSRVVEEDFAVATLRGLHPNMSATERLYGHDLTAKNSKIATLKPQNIILR